MSLSLEEEVEYTPLIDAILETSDLQRVSTKQIRKALQQQVSRDLTPQKTGINKLIFIRFNKFEAEQNGLSNDPNVDGNVVESTNEVSQADERAEPYPSSTPPSAESPIKRRGNWDSELSEAVSTPRKKKTKRLTDTIESDEAFAKRLQAEENLRARPTRGVTTRRSTITKKKRTPKAKTSRKVNAADDSEVDSNSDVKKVRKVNRNSGFHKELILSPTLSALFHGETKLSRPQTVKRIWEYIKANNLQDPNDKRQIICDEAMKLVFKTDRVHMFTMNKILTQNLYTPEDEE